MSEKLRIEAIDQENKNLYQRENFFENMQEVSVHTSYQGPEALAAKQQYQQSIERARSEVKAFYSSNRDTLHDIALEEDALYAGEQEPGEKDEYNYESAHTSNKSDHDVSTRTLNEQDKYTRVEPIEYSWDQDDDGWDVFDDVELEPALTATDKDESKGELPRRDQEPDEPDESEPNGESYVF